MNHPFPARPSHRLLLSPVLALLLVVPWIAGAATTAHAQNLVIAHAGVEGLSWTEALERFAELATEYSDGELEFTIYPASQLGSQQQMLESLRLGTVDITYAFEPLSQWVPEINVFSLPYLFEDIDHVRNVDAGPVGQEIKELLREEAGMRVLASFMREGRQLTTNKPIHSVEDVQGLKIRVTQSAAAIAAWEALGAKPVPMPMNEVFSALQQGVIDGQENPMSIIHRRQVYEVNDYIARTNHQFSPVWVVMSERRYQRLSPELQDAIQRAAAEAEAYEQTLAQQEWAEMEDILIGEGVQITEPDLSGFREAARSTYSEFPELLPYVETILGED